MSSSPDAPSSEGVERHAFDDAVSDVAQTRRLAIGATVIGAALLAGLARTWWAYLVALGSLVAVRFWVRRVVTARDEERSLAGRALTLDASGASIPRSDGSTTTVAWADVQRVEVDHERLVVVLRLRDAGEVEIEPSFGGLGLDGLAQRLESRRAAGRPGASRAG